MASEYAVFLFLSAFVTIGLTVPMYQHLKNKNMSAVALCIWLMISNIVGFINAALWPDYKTIYNRFDGRIYCDIVSRIQFTASAGQVGALAVIALNLARVLGDRNRAIHTRTQLRRKLALDCFLCYALPIWDNAVYYIVQSSRYYIIEMTGCQPVVDSSWLSIVLIFIWPPILALVAAFCAGLTIYRIWKYRSEFSDILKSTRSNTSKSRFIRLFVLSLIQIAFYVPVNIFVFILDLKVSHHSFDWNAVHGPYWNFIMRFPEVTGSIVIRWYTIFGAFTLIFFACIGDESTQLYRACAKKIGIYEKLPSWFLGPEKPKSSVSKSSQTGSSNRSSKWSKYLGLKGSKVAASHDDSTATSSHLRSVEFEKDAGLPLPATANVTSPKHKRNFSLTSPRTYFARSRHNDVPEATKDGIIITKSYDIKSSPEVTMVSRGSMDIDLESGTSSSDSNTMHGEDVPLKKLSSNGSETTEPLIA